MTVSVSRLASASFLRIALLAALCAASAACAHRSAKKKFFIEENAVARTRDATQNLPQGLTGDEAHANYSFEDLRGGDPQ